MTLRAKKPEYKENRLKMLLYGNHGTGKSHFCCSIPKAYFIDTEEIDQYSQFIGMLSEKESAFVTINTLEEVIQEVKALLSEKHDFRTLVIDSMSVLYNSMCNTEVAIVGDQYAKNTAKPKRLLSHLASLLNRLDMNVIITSHQKDKYEKTVTQDIVTKIYDVPDKMGYMIGMIARAESQGSKNRIQVTKTRYKEFTTGDWVDLDYKEFVSKLGKDLFERESVKLELATAKQIEELNSLIDLFGIKEEITSKWLTKAKSGSFDEMDKDIIQKCIDSLKEKITGDKNAISKS